MSLTSFIVIKPTMSSSFKNKSISIKFEKLKNDLKPEIDFEYKPDECIKWRKISILQFQKIKCSKINKFKKPFILDNHIQIYHKNKLIETSPIFLKKSMRNILNKMRSKQKDATILFMFDDQWRNNYKNPFKFKRFHLNDNIKMNQPKIRKIRKTRKTRKKRKKRKIYLIKSRRTMGSYFIGSTRRSRRLCV